MLRSSESFGRTPRLLVLHHRSQLSKTCWMSAGLTSFDFARFDFFDFVSRAGAGSSKPNKFSFIETFWRDICKKATDSSKPFVVQTFLLGLSTGVTRSSATVPITSDIALTTESAAREGSKPFIEENFLTAVEVNHWLLLFAVNRSA